MAKVLSGKMNCIMCGVATHHISAIQTHYTSSMHKHKFSLEFQQENIERQLMNLEDIRTNIPIKKVSFKEQAIMNHRLHTENENNIIRKFIYCDEYTKNIILKEIITKQKLNFLKHKKSIPSRILIKIYDNTIHLFMVWNKNLDWFNPNANVSYIDNFDEELINCLKSRESQTFEEYHCRLQILNFKDIIEKNYNLMMNYEL
jgi:hypothetical protein